MRLVRFMNHRITPKERGLLKGALRRVFSRSELRLAVVERSIIKGFKVPSRPKVKTWCKCSGCLTPTPKSYVVVDHIIPVIEIDTLTEDLSWDTIVDRLWCHPENLQALCEECHKVKTKEENRLRREFKKGRKDE